MHESYRKALKKGDKERKLFHNIEDCSFEILIHEEVKIITALSSEDGNACARKSIEIE